MTENVVARKLMAEKEMKSATYELTIVAMDMSKGFDGVTRQRLMEDLRGILDAK